MANLSRRILLAATGLAAVTSRARAEPSLELGPILDKYADACRAADVEMVARLFTVNGSYLRAGEPAAVGREALRAAFRLIFERIRVDVVFNIQEAAKYADVGWLRATSVARVKVLTTGKEGPFPYNNLVVVEPEAGVWKIRSYISAPTR